MSKFAVKLQCSNPDCLYSDNQIGQPVCARCQNQLTYRYLWAVQEQLADQKLADQELADQELADQELADQEQGRAQHHTVSQAVSQAVGQAIGQAVGKQKTYQFGNRAANSTAKLADIELGTLVDCRYLVLSPQIWLDTQPGLLTKVPPQISPQAAVYLRLHAYRLHLPQLYAIHQPDPNQPAILLLDNGPIQAPPTDGPANLQTGQLQPLLSSIWASAPAVRQLNWLWQMLQLWQPLQAQGVASSLLATENLHVEGWRFRMRQLIGDPVAVRPSAPGRVQASRVQAGRVLAGVAASTAAGASRAADIPGWSEPASAQSSAQSSARPSLADLGQLWSTWVETAQPTIRHLVRHLAEALTDPEADLVQIGEQLNQFLVAQAAEQPLQVDTAGATSTGPQRCHNEDACYPSGGQPGKKPGERPLPGVAMICDGIGGHAGGEVASQLALRSLQLQLRTWLAEIVTHTEPLPPAVIQQQLVRMVRVANNLIAAQNDLQGRSQRQRMGTTLTLAVQLPKTHWTETTNGNTHELYLVHVGDSRAYWLTPSACQQLTVDDDVANREVQAGRSLYSHCSRQDAAALTQALGTHEADQLQISVQRLVIDEDGVLLLCSDGLSDHGLVEQHWQEIMLPVLQDRIALEDVVQDWIKLADRHNGHDNSSVVLMHCRVQGAKRQIQFKPPAAAHTAPEAEASPDNELTESAKALLYDEPAPRAAVLPKRKAAPAKPLDIWVVAMGITSIAFVLGALGVAVWRELAPGRSQTSPEPAAPLSSPESPASSAPVQPELASPAAAPPELASPEPAPPELAQPEPGQSGSGQPELAQPLDPAPASPAPAAAPAQPLPDPAAAVESPAPTAPDATQTAGE